MCLLQEPAITSIAHACSVLVLVVVVGQEASNNNKKQARRGRRRRSHDPFIHSQHLLSFWLENVIIHFQSGPNSIDTLEIFGFLFVSQALLCNSHRTFLDDR